MEASYCEIEQNGFVIIDLTPEKISVLLFVWRLPRPADEIDTVEPAFTYTLKKP